MFALIVSENVAFFYVEIRHIQGGLKNIGTLISPLNFDSCAFKTKCFIVKETTNLLLKILHFSKKKNTFRNIQGGSKMYELQFVWHFLI